MIALKALGKIEDFKELIDQFEVKKEIAPRKEYVEKYEDKYNEYREFVEKMF